MAEWAKWLFTIIYLVNTVGTILLIGKPRKPISIDTAATVTVFAACLLIIIWKF
jgi:hypothetical protein